MEYKKVYIINTGNTFFYILWFEQVMIYLYLLYEKNEMGWTCGAYG